MTNQVSPDRSRQLPAGSGKVSPPEVTRPSTFVFVDDSRSVRVLRGALAGVKALGRVARRWLDGVLALFWPVVWAGAGGVGTLLGIGWPLWRIEWLVRVHWPAVVVVLLAAGAAVAVRDWRESDVDGPTVAAELAAVSSELAGVEQLAAATLRDLAEDVRVLRQAAEQRREA